MTDELKPAAPQPVVVTVVDTGGHGDSALTSGITGTTAAHLPDLVVTVIGPLAAIAIRFVNAYLTTLVGLITAGMATDIIPAADFWHLVLACAQLSFADAGLAALNYCLSHFLTLESKYPLGTGSI